MAQNIATPGGSGPPTALSALTVAGVPTMGMAGLPLTTGRVIFADYVNGSDGNDGSADFPVQTLSQAYSLATDGNNDVIVIVGDGSTAATQRLTATLTWAKDATHLVGMAAPSYVGQRARISHASTAPTTVFTPMVLVTASGCIFSNFSIYEGFNPGSSTACVTWEDQGQRNAYVNVNIQGMAGTGTYPTGDNASSANLKLTGGGERSFYHCAIGADTIARTAANASVWMTGGAARDSFEDCIYPMWANASGGSNPCFIAGTGSNAIQSWVLFKSCGFLNSMNISPVAAVAAAIISATPNGTFVLSRCYATGVTQWGAIDQASIRIDMQVAAEQGGLTVPSNVT